MGRHFDTMSEEIVYHLITLPFWLPIEIARRVFRRLKRTILT